MPTKKNTILIAFLLLLTAACKEDVIPKPASFLSLDYPAPSYTRTTTSCTYTFEKNALGKVAFKNDCSAQIEYPKLRGTIYLTYRPIKNNIKTLLSEAQKLTYEHVRKADNILEEKYINEQQNAYGMFYDVSGNAASQSQFYVTDSTNHFITGSIYFRAVPNYDSIYPAAAYLKNDIRHLMETISWSE